MEKALQHPHALTHPCSAVDVRDMFQLLDADVSTAFLERPRGNDRNHNSGFGVRPSTKTGAEHSRRSLPGDALEEAVPGTCLSKLRVFCKGVDAVFAGVFGSASLMRCF